jgi:hypothetical protein
MYILNNSFSQGVVGKLNIKKKNGIKYDFLDRFFGWVFLHNVTCVNLTLACVNLTLACVNLTLSHTVSTLEKFIQVL